MKTNKEEFFEFYDSEQYENAIKFYELNINDSIDSELKFFYALALFKIENYSKSIITYKELLLIEEKPEIYYNLSINQILAGNIDEGILTYKQLVDFCATKNINYISYKINITHSLIEIRDKENSKIFIYELSKEMLPFQEMDVHFLYMRQLPFYSDYLHCVKRYLDILSIDEARLEILQLSDNLNQSNYHILNEYSIEKIGESLETYEVIQQKKEKKTNVHENKSSNGCLKLIFVLIVLISLIIWKCN